jgi:lipopolysaccharide/colanic/teichoic acid biosynthesis glycosyltransferase
MTQRPENYWDGCRQSVWMSNYGKWPMLRLFDFILAFLGLTVGLPVLVLLVILGFLDTRSPLFFQVRVGRQQKSFVLVKFRTMKPNTASVATHLADVSAITPLGALLRKTKLDELPQLWNVLKGEMSLVGPRPCLFDQVELIEERERRSVFDARPGITGLAQVNAIDMSTPELLAETDALMLKNLSISAYWKYIFMTIAGKGSGDRIKDIPK